MSFSSKKIFYADSTLIPSISDELVEQFEIEGYAVSKLPLGSGGADISITKGGIFKAVLGMKTALKITLKPHGNHILAEASIGIFGQQAIPTAITLFFFWPVILTQIWGMVQQSHLDDHAMELISNSISRLNPFNQKYPAHEPITPTGRFCPNCGEPVTGRFCASCGQKLD